MSRDKYDPAGDHLGTLVDVEGLAPVAATEGSRTKAEKTVGSGFCPEHNDDRRTGVVRQGIHVVWRVHDKRTIGGLAMPCRASGVPLCESPPGLQPRGQRKQADPPSCTHVV